MRSVLPVLAVAALAAGAALCAAPARGAPPGTPTLEAILQDAVAAKKAKAAAEAAAKRNPVLDRINAYRDGVTPLKQFKFLTEVVQNAKDAKTAPYRMEAARALVDRFAAEGTNDVVKRKTRREIGLELVSLMKASSSDKTGLQAVELVMNSWWRSQVQALGFKATGKFRDRAKAAREMNNYLKKRAN